MVSESFLSTVFNLTAFQINNQDVREMLNFYRQWCFKSQ